jgi:metal-responsive CopG/Arc/MetJ family transcriptional regulator
MEHLSITFPEDLRHALDHEARVDKTKRSTLIQKAVRIYLKLKRQGQMDELLKEGYAEMASVSTDVMRDFEQTDKESLKHVD